MDVSIRVQYYVGLMYFQQLTLIQIRSIDVHSVLRVQKSAPGASKRVFRPELELERPIRYETDQCKLLQNSQIMFMEI